MGISALAEPTRNFGKYMLMEKVGEGSLGPVYRGFDPDLGRAVVVRTLWDGTKWNEKAEEIFFRECRAVAALQHVNIAALYEFGKEENAPYIVMESLGSNNLQSLILRKPAMSVEAKLSIMIQVADGLSHAHKNGVLHRNLTPAKIHLTTDGGVKIRDFAVADALARHLPHPGVRYGVPIYLSPEQIQNKGCDERSEIFSAGTIFYELITFLHPFHDPNSNKALDNILQDTEIPTFEQFPDEPPGIWPILKKCLARNPGDRYQDMEEVSMACRDLVKDLAEDTRLMLAELHASLAPLKKAAAQTNASENTVKLLQDATRLLNGHGSPDYTSLDRLMTDLIGQYPAIQEAAGAPQALEPEHIRFPEKAEEQVASPVENPPPPGLPCDGEEQEPLGEEMPVFADPKTVAEPPVTAQVQQTAAKAPEDAATPPENMLRAAPESSGPADIPAVLREEVNRASMELPEAVPASPEQDPPDAPDEENAPGPAFSWKDGSLPRLIYRSAITLLFIILMVLTIYVALRNGAAASLQKVFAGRIQNARTSADTTGVPQAALQSAGPGAASNAAQQSSGQNAASILMNEARTLASMNRLEESKVLLRRILEIEPGNEAAGAALKEIEESRGASRENAADPALQKQLARISSLISTGKLPPAKAELDKLQRTYPNSREVIALRKRWQSKNAGEMQERARQEEEQQKAVQKQKREEEWNRKVADLFALGKYNEAGSALSGWMAEDPGSFTAREFSGRIQEIQRGLKSYSTAMAESRYQDASGALAGVERINPADPGIAELRRQIEARKVAARATLTVHRLGSRGTLLLDGKPFGNDGEIGGENIPIGYHTLAIESDGTIVVSRSQEFFENQSVSLVYDVAHKSMRPMAETDRELLSQRKAMEAVYRYAVDHPHGILRGNCRGVLSVSYSDVSYKPSSGSHGFRVPFNQLKARSEGKSVELLYALDDRQFHSFKFPDLQSAENFRRKWSELKSLTR